MAIRKEVVRNSGPNYHFPGNLFSLLRTKTVCVYQSYSFVNLDKMVWNPEEEQEFSVLM